MMCEQCQTRQATVHFTKIVGGEKSEYHLCEQCAKEKGTVFAKAAQAFDFNHLLSGLLNMESSPGIAAPQPGTQRCDVCGLSYNQFTQTGRFGCPNCYDSFATRLEPLLRRIQNNGQHTGKVPGKAGEQVKRKKTLDHLRIELQQAVAAEQFEQAAELRDKIRAFEQSFEQ